MSNSNPIVALINLTLDTHGVPNDDSNAEREHNTDLLHGILIDYCEGNNTVESYEAQAVIHYIMYHASHTTDNEHFYFNDHGSDAVEELFAIINHFVNHG